MVTVSSALNREEIILLPTKYQSILDDAIACMRTYGDGLCYVSTAAKSDLYTPAEGEEKNQLFIGLKDGDTVRYQSCEEEALRRVMQLSGMQYIVADEDTFAFCCNQIENEKESVTSGLVYSKNVSALLRHFGFPPTSITESDLGFISYDETEVNNCYYEYIFGKYYYYQVTMGK